MTTSDDARLGLAVKSGYSPVAPEKPGAAFRSTRVAVVGTRWNHELVDALIAGASRCLHGFGVLDINITELRVPGAFELPLATEALMHSGRFDAVVALGAVIRGETPHFDYVCTQCSQGLREASQRYRVPVGFGVLTVENPQQGAARAGSGLDNKGYQAAAAALEMVALLREIK
ncbi:MAG TPA: 6,7-dimethyl-8-ribityllumazine synthase [Nevskiaceae bacterium]|nr:6,7-dimethyl-8-ribityllumazine synthase [Nevskiaceae bacterium]